MRPRRKRALYQQDQTMNLGDFSTKRFSFMFEEARKAGLDMHADAQVHVHSWLTEGKYILKSVGFTYSISTTGNTVRESINVICLWIII